MKKYRVWLEAVASFCVEVEAPDEEAAIEAAFVEAPNGVCGQCSGWNQHWSLDISDFDLMEDMPPEAVGDE